MTRGWIRAFAAVLLAAVCLVAGPARAVSKVELPARLDGHVVDTSGTLSREDVLDLDHKLESIRLRTGFAIVALVVGALQDEPIEDVAYRAFNTWQIGEKGKDDGVLIVVAPVDRRVRIETGKGVGGALTDLQSNDIIREDMSPLLRQGRLHDAIEAGANAVAKDLVQGTPGAGGRPGTRPGAAQAPPLSPLTMAVAAGSVLLVIVLLIVSPGFRSFFFTMLQMFFIFGGRGGSGGGGGGGGGGGSGYSGGGGQSGGGGSSDSY